jgi:hypothetical protein
MKIDDAIEELSGLMIATHGLSPLIGMPKKQGAGLFLPPVFQRNIMNLLLFFSPQFI